MFPLLWDMITSLYNQGRWVPSGSIALETELSSICSLCQRCSISPDCLWAREESLHGHLARWRSLKNKTKQSRKYRMLPLLSPGTRSLSCRQSLASFLGRGLAFFCQRARSQYLLSVVISIHLSIFHPVCVFVCVCTYVHINMSGVLVLLQVPTKTLYRKWLLDLPDRKLPLAMDIPW